MRNTDNLNADAAWHLGGRYLKMALTWLGLALASVYWIHFWALVPTAMSVFYASRCATYLFRELGG